MSFQSTDLVTSGSVTAKAHVNIALIKYWGKAPAATATDANLPAVPSLSLTLTGLWTETTIAFDPSASGDHGTLNGVSMTDAMLERCKAVLDRVRVLADVKAPFRVDSTNHVPTAAGLASSASGMAALAGAASRCAGLTDPEGRELSALARLGSGSACRSVFGGWVTWEGEHAVPLAPENHWDVCLLVAIVDAGPKHIHSREAMNHTAATSPFYAGWVESAGETYAQACKAVRDRDMATLAQLMENSALRMHGCAMAANPPVRYMAPGSLAVIDAMNALRRSGVVCGWTMDAGPNVKILCERKDAAIVLTQLHRVTGLKQIVTCGPGPGMAIEVNSA
jgi:diphosphomevalonate decarboxylase